MDEKNRKQYFAPPDRRGRPNFWSQTGIATFYCNTQNKVYIVLEIGAGKFFAECIAGRESRNSRFEAKAKRESTDEDFLVGFFRSGNAPQRRNSDEVIFSSVTHFVFLRIWYNRRVFDHDTDSPLPGKPLIPSQNIIIILAKASLLFNSTALICPVCTITWFWSSKKPSRNFNRVRSNHQRYAVSGDKYVFLN